ncbi:DNA sulfur modification protein DndB [Peribacillus loiseleuriae]|uniref:DNA sulfur modification protein DndB n=1 Tax=Peribacillus loiseleuriae TaxID=1679170 RepID=UPI003CFF524F
MIVNKSPDELIEYLLLNLKLVKENDKKINKIKNELVTNNNFIPGAAQELINSTEDDLSDLDLRLICLLTEHIYVATGDKKLKTDEWFTPKEIKTSMLYDYAYETHVDSIKLPLTMPDPFLKIDDKNYIGYWDAQFANQLLSDLLSYNPETQRETRKIQRNNQIEFAIKIYPHSIKEMTAKLLKGKLGYTTITINALVGTSDTGKELSYNPKNMTLTVNEGTELNILDGMHRLNAIKNALEINPNLKHKVQVAIKNFNLPQAKEFLADISKQNAISKDRVKELEKNRFSDDAMNYLNLESDLKDRISVDGHVSVGSNEIVRYGVLSDAINSEFIMKSRLDADKVGERLSKFFYYLFGLYPDEFINDVNRIKKKSYINTNRMFAGYVVLAKRMVEENISFENIKDILDSIDFDRKNPLWKEIGYVNSSGAFHSGSEKNIMNFFRNLDLKKSMEEN